MNRKTVIKDSAQGVPHTESAEPVEEKDDEGDEQAVEAEVRLQGRCVSQDAFPVDTLGFETVVPADTSEQDAGPRDDTAN